MESSAKNHYSVVSMDQNVEIPCDVQLIATASAVPMFNAAADSSLDDEGDEDEIFPSNDDYFQGREGIVKVFDHGINTVPSSGWHKVYSFMICTTFFALWISFFVFKSLQIALILLPLAVVASIIGCFDCFERCFPARLQLHSAMTDHFFCHEIVPQAYSRIMRPCAISIPFEKIETVKVVKTVHGIHNVEIGTLPDGSDDLDANFIASGIPPEDLFCRHASPVASAIAGIQNQDAPKPMYVMTLYGLLDPYRLKRVLLKRVAKSRPSEKISCGDDENEEPQNEHRKFYFSIQNGTKSYRK